MRSVSGLIAGLRVWVCVTWGDEGHQHALTEEEVASVQFSTSCSRDVAGNFNRAVALLHSFQYEQTRQAFAQIAKEHPDCAMAQWGIAMSHYDGVWAQASMCTAV